MLTFPASQQGPPGQRGMVTGTAAEMIRRTTHPMKGLGLRNETMTDHARPARIGLYPGTFDPVTNGHLDVIARAARLLDKLVVGVSISAGKGPMFSLEERVELVQAEIASIADKNGMVIEVLPFDTLLVDFARKIGVSMIVRGLRAVTDFDIEFQMAGMNYRMAPDIETVFLMASERHQFIASRLVKEVAMLGGDITSFVPPLTLDRVMQHIRETKI